MCACWQTYDKGWGLFAKSDLTRLQFLIEYVGEIIDVDECERRITDATKQGHTHLYHMNLNDKLVHAQQIPTELHFCEGLNARAYFSSLACVIGMPDAFISLYNSTSCVCGGGHFCGEGVWRSIYRSLMRRMPAVLLAF